MSKFEYPMLSRAEIMTLLAESEIAVSERDLLHPTPDFVYRLYTDVLIILDFLTEEEDGQIEFSGLEQLEHPESHMDSAPIMKLNRRMKQVVAAVDSPEQFTLKDLIKPDANRTEFFLSAILNFWLYKSAKIRLHTPIMDEITALGDQQRDLEAKISELNAEIADYNEARERELPIVQEIDVRIKELQKTIEGLNNHQVPLRASCRKMKEKAAEMDEKISNAEFLLVQSVQENANLRSKVVQSPDKLLRALEEKKSGREEAKNAERSAMQAFQEKTTVLEVYTKVLEKMSKHFAQMQAIQEQVNAAKSVEKEIKTLKTKLSDESIIEKSIEANLVEKQAKVQMLDDLRKQLAKERDLRYEEATKEINKVQLEVEAKRHDLVRRQNNVETVLAEVDALTSRTNSIRESGLAKQKELTHKCEEIVKEFHHYVNSIGVLLPMVEVER